MLSADRPILENSAAGVDVGPRECRGVPPTGMRARFRYSNVH